MPQKIRKPRSTYSQVEEPDQVLINSAYDYLFELVRKSGAKSNIDLER